MGALPGVPHLAGGGGPARCPRATTCSTTRGASDEPALFEVSCRRARWRATRRTRRCPAAPPCFTVPPGAQPATSSPSRCRASSAAAARGTRRRRRRRRRRHRRRRRTKAPGAGARPRRRAAAARWRRRRRAAGGLSERRSGDVRWSEVRRARRRLRPSGVEVDDEEQAPPTVEAGSAERADCSPRWRPAAARVAARAPKAAKLAYLPGASTTRRAAQHPPRIRRAARGTAARRGGGRDAARRSGRHSSQRRGDGEGGARAEGRAGPRDHMGAAKAAQPASAPPRTWRGWWSR